MNPFPFDWGPLLKGGPLFIGILNLSVSPEAIRETFSASAQNLHVG